jgi:hypothetical protein
MQSNGQLFKVHAICTAEQILNSSSKGLSKPTILNFVFHCMMGLSAILNFVLQDKLQYLCWDLNPQHPARN